MNKQVMTNLRSDVILCNVVAPGKITEVLPKLRDLTTDSGTARMVFDPNSANLWARISCLSVACADGVITGWAMAYWSPLGNELWAYVKPEYRRRKVGTRLVRQVMTKHARDAISRPRYIDNHVCQAFWNSMRIPRSNTRFEDRIHDPV